MVDEDPEDWVDELVPVVQLEAPLAFPRWGVVRVDLDGTSVTARYDAAENSVWITGCAEELDEAHATNIRKKWGPDFDLQSWKSERLIAIIRAVAPDLVRGRFIGGRNYLRGRRRTPLFGPDSQSPKIVNATGIPYEYTMMALPRMVDALHALTPDAQGVHAAIDRHIWRH